MIIQFDSICLTHREERKISMVSVIFRLGLLLLLAFFTLKFWFMNYTQVENSPWIYRFLHSSNLPIHEFGHVLFSPLPRLMTSLGGSLTQILTPLLLAVAILFSSKDPFGAAIGLWWAFENVFDCAAYIADARAGKIPLIGGNFGESSPYGFHDWNFILNELGLLSYDQLFGKLAYGIGILGMVACLGYGAYILYEEYKICEQNRFM